MLQARWSKLCARSAYLALSITWLCFVEAAAVTWGADKTRAECKSESIAQKYDVLTGSREPYAFLGPSDECHTKGCDHGYWGRKCRFSPEIIEPSCPLETRLQLTHWLRQQAENKAQWAEDILSAQPCELWEHIRGRTVWVAGDSLAQDLGNAIFCFMIEYYIEAPMGVDKRGVLPNASEELYRLVDQDVSNNRQAYWCHSLGESTNICYLNADKGPRLMHVMRLLPKLAAKKDIVVMNMGIHYNDMDEFNEDLHSLADVIQEVRADLPKRLYWKDVSPQHFGSLNGMIDMSKPIVEQTCFPPGHGAGTELIIQPDGTLAPKDGYPGTLDQAQQSAVDQLLQGGPRNMAARAPVNQMGIKLLPIYNITLPVWQTHHHILPKGHGGTCEHALCDCTHACFGSWSSMIQAAFTRLLAEDADKVEEEHETARKARFLHHQMHNHTTTHHDHGT